MYVAEIEESMHTSRDEPNCQLEKSISKENAAALRMKDLVRDTYHVVRTLCRGVLGIKTPQWSPA